MSPKADSIACMSGAPSMLTCRAGKSTVMCAAKGASAASTEALQCPQVMSGIDSLVIAFSFSGVLRRSLRGVKPQVGCSP